MRALRIVPSPGAVAAIGPPTGPTRRPSLWSSSWSPSASFSWSWSSRHRWTAWLHLLTRASRQARTTLRLLVCNVAVSAVAAFVAAFLASRGNVFSPIPTAQQSRRTFLVASLLCTHVLGSSFGLLIAVSRLRTKRFLACDAQRPRVGFVLRRVLRFAWLHVVVSTAAVVAMGVGCDALPAAARPWKLEYYFHTIIGQYFSSACDANVRVVLNHETVEGRERQQQRQRQQQPQLQPRHRRLPSAASLYGSSSSSSSWSWSSFVASVRRWRRSFVQSLPLLGSAMVAGLYIHVVSAVQRRSLSSHSTRDANWFVGGSLLLKLALQELAKLYLMRRRVTSLPHMCIVVGVPTVLIDTQARVVVLGLQDATSTLVNAYVMAIVELVVRLTKLLWLRRVVRKRRKLAERDAMAVAAVHLQKGHRRGTVTGRDTGGGTGGGTRVHAIGPEDPRVAFRTWRQQLVGLHTAETLADMYAEYIAIVCSAAVAVFWASSPQYTIGRGRDTRDTRGSGTSATLALTVAVQLVVELLVDFVASVVEIAAGVELDHARGGFGVFLGSLFLMLTVVNMNMSAVLYIRDT